MDDKRRHPRFSTHLETIYFSAELGDERMYYPGVIISRSRDGLGMDVNFPHEISDNIWLEGLEGIPSPIKATVQWSSQHAMELNQYTIGLSFDT